MAVCELSGDHPREKIMKTENRKDKNVFLIAQELKLARVLAGNNKTCRDKALKNLKKWFSHRTKTLPFTDNDFQIIWKGLYFSMWMSDKPLIQEECAENIASLIHFQTLDESLLFFKAGLTILINEWFGIDQLRLDKFFMLVRRLLRQMLVELKIHGLSKKNIDKFNEVVSFTVLNTDIHPPVGLFMHFTEIFLEELAKVTKGNVASDRLVDFIEPFIKKLSSTSDGREIAHLKKFIFIHLIKQSNLGLDYQDKYEAWKREGFPGSIDSMQKLKLDKGNETKNNENFEETTDDKPLDPRAGRVDVDLPQLKFKPKDVVNALTKYKFDKGSNSKSRRNIADLINLFTKMSKGVYPIGVKKVLGDKESYDANVRKAANRLIKFEKKLLGKEKKKRKRTSENDDEKANVPEKRRKVENSKLEDADKISGNGDSSGKDSREKKKKKADLSKKQKIVDHTNQDMDNEEATNGDNVSEKKLKNRKVVKTKRDPNERNKENALTKGDVDDDRFDKLTQKRLAEFIEQSEGGVNREIKKRMKEVEIPSKKVEGTSNKKDQTAKRKRKNEITNDQKEMRKKRKNKKENEIIDNIECVFERNSGTWVVFDISKERDNLKLPSQQTGAKKGDLVVSSSSNHKNANTSGNSEAPAAFSEQSNALGGGLGSPKAANEASSKNTTPVTNFSAEEGSPKSGLSPVRLFESPRNATELFPKFAWDEPLQEGEYEICIPSKKHVAKLKRQAKKQNQNVHELINTSMKQLRGKGRHSLDLNLVKNQFSTPNSAKKVKINTKLNRSQEIHEHVQQILSSPGIPYDANKKPSKPLLKTSATSTPVNPFYNKQLNVW